MEFKHGDVIEYKIQEEWRKGVFVALSPMHDGYAIHMMESGFVSERHIDKIRKPKQKKEGWIALNPQTRITSGRECSFVYPSEEEALRIMGQGGILARVEWEE